MTIKNCADIELMNVEYINIASKKVCRMSAYNANKECLA